MGGLSRGRLSDETGIPLKTTFGLGVVCDDGLLNTWHQGGGLLIEGGTTRRPVWIGQASSHEATVPGEEGRRCVGEGSPAGPAEQAAEGGEQLPVGNVRENSLVGTRASCLNSGSLLTSIGR